MKKTSLGPLTIEKLIQVGGFVGVTPGHALIERFCAAVSAGAVPDSDDMKLLANALQPLRYSAKENGGDDARREALENFSKLLGLTKKQGRQKKGAGEIESLSWAVVLFKIRYAEQLAAGQTKKQAELRARAEAATFAKIGDRAMRNRIRDHGHFADMMIQSFGEETLKKILEVKSGK